MTRRTPTTLKEKSEVQLATAEVSLANSIAKTAKLFDTIIDSIDPSEINDMKVTEKINALKSLSFIYVQSNKLTPSKAVFQKINVFSAKVEDLEKGLLDFAENKDE